MEQFLSRLVLLMRRLQQRSHRDHLLYVLLLPQLGMDYSHLLLLQVNLEVPMSLHQKQFLVQTDLSRVLLPLVLVSALQGQ